MRKNDSFLQKMSPKNASSQHSPSNPSFPTHAGKRALPKPFLAWQSQSTPLELPFPWLTLSPPSLSFPSFQKSPPKAFFFLPPWSFSLSLENASLRLAEVARTVFLTPILDLFSFPNHLLWFEPD